MDAILYSKFSDDANVAIRQMQNAIAIAKICNTLFNLPEVLKSLEGEFDKQKEQKLKFIKSQEGGRI